MNTSLKTITAILKQSICVLLTLFLAPVASGQVEARRTSARTSSMIPKCYKKVPFKQGEVLRYSVRWTFIHIGTLELRQLPAGDSGNKLMYVQLTARTASGLPFIDLYMKERTLLDPSNPRLTELLSRQIHEPKLAKRFRYDVNTRKFSERIRPHGEPETYRERIVLNRPFDGIGMLMFLRGLSGSGERMTLPIITDFDVSKSRIHCSRAVEYIEVPAFDKDVAAHKTSVSSSWEHSRAGGLQGNFEFWCSTDPAAVFLRAEIELAIGSMVLELESFQRKGWKYGIPKKFAADAEATSRGM